MKEKISIETKNIFIDTNIYKSKKFQFNKYELKTVQELSASNFIQLLLSPIVNKEIEAHIKKEIKQAISVLNKAANEVKILRNTPNIPQYSIFNKISHQNIENKIIELFNNFKNNSKALEVTYDNVSSNQIIEDYFIKKPPFSEKKKSEFPDAFILASLYNWAEANDEKIIVISNDGDFKSYCDLYSQRLIYCDNLNVFLNSLFSQMSQTTELFEFAEEIFSKLEQDIDGQLEKILPNVGYSSNAYELDDEVEDIEIEEFFLINSNIIKVDNEKALFHLDVEVRLDAYHHYYDYDRSVWDSEDKKYLFKAVNSARMRHIEEATAYLEINLNGCKISKLEFEFDNIELDFFSGELVSLEEHFD